MHVPDVYTCSGRGRCEARLQIWREKRSHGARSDNLLAYLQHCPGSFLPNDITLLHDLCEY
jgi:hypothetical protein